MTNKWFKQIRYSFQSQSIMRIALLITVSAIVACTNQESDTAAVQVDSSKVQESIATTDAWSGQWNGPEGTFLMITGSQGQYEITIQNLDGPISYNGSSVDHQIEFERKEVKEIIHPADGAGTGMKWLVDKKNCLTIRPGEGYCRE